MSNDSNEELLERVEDIKVYFEGTDLVTALENNIERGDWEMVHHLAVEAEAEMARQHFYASDALSENDVY